MPEYSVPGYDELPKGERIVLLGGEKYLLKVLEAKTEWKLPYMATPETPKVEKTVYKFQALSFDDGSELLDVNETPVPTDKTIYFWYDVDQNHLGFMRDGTAALGRQLLLSLNGISDMRERVPAGNSDDLIGLTVVAYIDVTSEGKNKIKAFKTPSRRRGRAAAAEEAAPTATVTRRGSDLADAVEALAKAEASGETPDLSAVQAFFDKD